MDKRKRIKIDADLELESKRVNKYIVKGVMSWYFKSFF